MTMQNIPDAPDAPEPSRPRLERAADAKPRPASVDSLVDAAMDALTGEAPANDNAHAPEARKTKRTETDAAEPQEAEEDAALGEGPEAVDAADDTEADEGDQADLRGSEQDPFSVKDLPSDKFIEVKVDGKKEVIPLSELANGYIREQTFSRRLNETKQLTERAQAMAEAAQQFPEKLRQQLKAWTSDPREIFAFFTENAEREHIFEQAARAFAEMRIQHRDKPELRLQYERERQMRAIQAERERFEAQKRAELEARQQEQMRAQALAIWQPGWNEGLRRAGFPEVTPQLQEEVMVRCRQRVDAGKTVTSDDIAEFVVRAAKLLELPKASDKKPKPAPQPAVKPERRETRRANDWNKVPRHERVRSADYFLSGLKPRDFR